MKDFTDADFNMRACFYEESKVVAKKRWDKLSKYKTPQDAKVYKSRIAKIKSTIVVGTLEEAKKTPHWFRIEEMANNVWSVVACPDDELAKEFGQVIIRQGGIYDS